MAVKKSAAGRKSKYYEYVKPYLEDIRKMRESGWTEERIMKYLKVNHNSWNNYKKEFSELRDVLKLSTDKLVLELEQTLFQLARNGNVAALFFSLKNLASDRWQDKQVADLTLKEVPATPSFATVLSSQALDNDTEDEDDETTN